VVQNHLLKLLAYLTMEAPDSDSADDQCDAKNWLFRAVRTVDPVEVVRGQYDGYRGPPVCPADSTTETFVALTLHIDNWRWAGVPVFVRAGKAMPMTLLDVVLVLQPPPRDLFRGPDQTPQSPNRIRLRLQPDAGVTVTLLAKQPANRDLATEIPVSVDFRSLADRRPGAHCLARTSLVPGGQLGTARRRPRRPAAGVAAD
jgi:glucose-6-phosphate 1-dehydrogenase